MLLFLLPAIPLLSLSLQLLYSPEHPIHQVAVVDRSEEVGKKLGGFLMKEIENYPNWIVKNNYDPTPVNPRITVEVRYQNKNGDYVSGTFSDITIEGIGKHFPSVNSGHDLINHVFDLGYYMEKVTMRGTYTANGTVHSNITVTGNGNWSAQFPDGKNSLTHKVEYKNYKITNDGYISLKNARVSSELTHTTYGSYGVLGGNEASLEFEGLSAGKYQDEVARNLFKGFVPYHWTVASYNMTLYAKEKVKYVKVCSNCDPLLWLVDKFIRERFAVLLHEIKN